MWITPEILKRYGFRNVQMRTEVVTRLSIHSPSGDPQFLELADDTNGIFIINRFPDPDDSDEQSFVYIHLVSEYELKTLISILGKK